MEPAVEVVLTGVSCQFTARAILKTRDSSWLQVELEARFSGWNVPTAAESLATADDHD
ncbi:hypothetical protein [Levilactobacillus parabrevis]|uniref:hypothetical protein n=1 Tax=Levilactobacillus parabrevis TaxID=357278 RepID=UPI0021A65EF7|nr:hypothetical protein [Levilactobacillus parabrevis]